MDKANTIRLEAIELWNTTITTKAKAETSILEQHHQMPKKICQKRAVALRESRRSCNIEAGGMIGVYWAATESDGTQSDCFD